MKWLSVLWSLIKKLLDWLLHREKEDKGKEEHYTREQFVEAVKELSKDPVWRARILKDALMKLREMKTFSARWVDRDDISDQCMNKVFGCGLSFSFGEGIHALDADDWKWLISALQQDAIQYVKEFTDCDNFATFFKGFADFVVGKPVVIYTTGLVFEPVEQYGQKVCICKSDYLVGGHGWNRIVTTDSTEVEKVCSTEKICYDFTVFNYEPQNDMLGDKIIGGRCYMSGGGLPIIYGRRG